LIKESTGPGIISTENDAVMNEGRGPGDQDYQTKKGRYFIDYIKGKMKAVNWMGEI